MIIWTNIKCFSRKINKFFGYSNLPELSGIYVDEEITYNNLERLTNYLYHSLVGKKIIVSRHQFKNYGYYNKVRFI